MTDYKDGRFECFLTMKIPVELHLFMGNSEEIFFLEEKLHGEILFLEILLLNKNLFYINFWKFRIPCGLAFKESYFGSTV